MATDDDITERKRAEEALRESEERFRSAFEHAAIGMALVATDGRFLQVNRALCQMLGYSGQELTSTTWQAITHPDDLDIGHGHMRRMLAREMDSCQFEKRYLHKLGHEVWTLLSFSLVRDADGNPLYFISQIQDITAHRRAEEALRSIVEGTSTVTGDEFFRSLVRNLASALEARYALVGELVSGAQDRVRTLAVWAGEGFDNNFEYDLRATPCENVIGKTMCHYPSGVRELFRHDHLPEKMAGVDSYLGAPLFDSSGKALGHLVVAHDEPMDDASTASSILTIFAARAGTELERKRVEEELRESEERFRSVFESAPIAMAIGNPEGRPVQINRALQEMLGYTENELQSMDFTDFTHPDDVEESVRLVGELLEGKRDYFRIQKRYYRKDGRLVWGDLAASAFRSSTGERRYVAMIEDITERKRVEEALQVAREELEGKVERQLLRRNPYGLTFRELTVLHLVAAGRSDKEIGSELGISPLTAQKHISNILAKMDVASRTEASVRAVREGLLE